MLALRGECKLCRVARACLVVKGPRLTFSHVEEEGARVTKWKQLSLECEGVPSAEPMTQACRQQPKSYKIASLHPLRILASAGPPGTTLPDVVSWGLDARSLAGRLESISSLRARRREGGERGPSRHLPCHVQGVPPGEADRAAAEAEGACRAR